jgi:ABC-type sugar transport system ATPase subunit
MIYISHHLEEVFRVCDRISVLRDGKNSGLFLKENVDIEKIVGAMIGKEYDDTVVKATYRDYSDRPVALEARDFQAETMKHPVSFKIHKGEILGITGIVGAGKSELSNALFGAEKRLGGELYINGGKAELNTPLDAKKLGLAYIPEDRKGKGLFLIHNLEDNLTVANVELVSGKGGVLKMQKKTQVATEIARKMKVKPLDLKMEARQLSGGNQQKVVLGKWLVGSPQILIMDEPTWGIDVGAKAEIYDFIAELAADGVSVIVLSSEFNEILTLSNRIMVLRHGEITHELKPEDTSSEELLTLSLEVLSSESDRNKAEGNIRVRDEGGIGLFIIMVGLIVIFAITANNLSIQTTLST